MSDVVFSIKGKSASHLARTYREHRQNFAGQHFWARGYFVSTVGRDEKAIREYIRSLEVEDKRLDQLRVWKVPPVRPAAITTGPRQRPRSSYFERLTP